MRHPLAVADIWTHALECCKYFAQTFRDRFDLGEELIKVRECPWDVTVYQMCVLVKIFNASLNGKWKSLEDLKQLGVDSQFISD